MRGVEEDLDVNLCKPLEESWWSLTGSRALNLSISMFTISYFVNEVVSEERALTSRSWPLPFSYSAGSHYHCGCHHLWPNGLVVRCSLWVMLRLNTLRAVQGSNPCWARNFFFWIIYYIYIGVLFSFDSISAQVNAESDHQGCPKNCEEQASSLRYCHATRARDARSIFCTAIHVPCAQATAQQVSPRWCSRPTKMTTSIQRRPLSQV